MTRRETTAYEKVRALFLAALMVVSVFGGTVAFAGSAAAANGSVVTDADAYGNNDDIVITVTDSGADSTANSDEVTVDVTSSSKETETVTLTETGDSTGEFTGSITVNDDATNSDGDLDATDGDTITVTYTDTSNNERTATATFDTTAPDVSFTVSNPSDTQKVVVTVTSTNEPLDKSSIEATLSGAESTTLTGDQFSKVGDYKYKVKYSGSTDGQYDVTLNTAKDDAGNDGASGTTHSVTVDTAAPTFSNASPTDVVVDNQKKITVDVADSTSDIASFKVNVTDSNGDLLTEATTAKSGISYSGGTLTIDPATVGFSYADGDVNVDVNATDNDKDANQGSTSWSFTVDTDGPDYSNATPADGSLVNESQPDISVDLSDASGVNSSSIAITVANSSDTLLDSAGTGTDGVSFSDGTLTVDSTTTGLDFEDGSSITVDVTAEDTAGVSSSTSFSFDVDTSAPTVENATATDTNNGDGFVGDGETVSVSVDVKDDNFANEEVTVDASDFGAADNVTLTYDAGTTYTGSFTVDAANSSGEGEYSLTITAEDDAGNINTNETNTLKLDAPPSNLSIEEPFGDEPLLKRSGDTLQVTYTYKEDHVDTAVLQFNNTATNADVDYEHVINDSQYVDDGATKTIEFYLLNSGSNLTDGTYNVTLKVTDDAGNSNTTTEAKALTIDDNEPTVSINSVSPGSANTSSEVTVEYTYSDAATNGTVTISLGSATHTAENVEPGTHTHTFNLSNESLADNSEYDVTVEATDAAGHSDSTTQEDALTVDNGAPVLESAEAQVGSDEVTITFNETVVVDDATDFAYEDVNVDGASAIESVEAVNDDTNDGIETGTTFVVTLDSEVTANDLSADRISVRENLVYGFNGETVGIEPVTLEDTTAPSLYWVSAENASNTVTVVFSEDVFAGDGGELSAENFTYDDASGDGASAIKSVSHKAGSSAVEVTLSSDVQLSDISEDSISIKADGAYDVADNAASGSGTLLASDSVNEFTVTNPSDSTIKVTITSDEQLTDLTVPIYTEWQIHDETQNRIATLTEEDFTVSEANGEYTYTATVQTDRDGRYGVQLQEAVDVAGAHDWGHKVVNIDTEDPKPTDAEIVDASETHTLVKVTFNEPVYTDFLEASDVSVDGKTAVDVYTVNDIDGVVYVKFDGELETGDEPALSIASNGYHEAAGDFTFGVKDASTVVHTVKLDLQKGQNFVSVPAEYGTVDIANSAFAASEVTSIMTYDDGEWHTYNPAKPDSEQDFTELEGGQGYIVTVDSDVTLDVNVRNAEPGTSAGSATPGDQQLEEGWNLVGHWQEGNQNVDTALGTITESGSTHIWGQKTGGEFSYKPVTSFEPGEAYWVFVEDDEVYTAAEYGMTT